LWLTPWYEDIATNGDSVSTPWEFWSWTAATTDTYILKFGIANAMDSTLDSRALFDANTVIPEPGTIILFGSGLIGLGGFVRKGFNFKK
jgi:hypothetical protein